MRSFIAIELTEEARAALAGIQGEFEKCSPDIKWVKPGNIHITLKFLGNIEDSITERIVMVIEKISNISRPFLLTLQGVGIFPNVRSPRVLWVGLDGGHELEVLQKEIEKGMESLGFEAERRRFTPHVTLGRFRSSAGKDCFLRVMERHKNSIFGTVEVRAVVFMRSDLHPDGARYTRIREVLLSGPEVSI